jgi:hypothetical protein
MYNKIKQMRGSCFANESSKYRHINYKTIHANFKDVP